MNESLRYNQFFFSSHLTETYLKWSREAGQRVRGPVVWGEGHYGLEDVFTPSPMDGVRTCEKVYKEKMKKRKNIYKTHWPVPSTGEAWLRDKPTCDVRGSGQREDQGSVQLLRLGRQHRLGVVEEARELRLHFGAPQGCDEPQGRALHAAARGHAQRGVKGLEERRASKMRRPVRGTYHRCSWFWLVWGTAARLCR